MFCVRGRWKENIGRISISMNLNVCFLVINILLTIKVVIQDSVVCVCSLCWVHLHPLVPRDSSDGS